MVGILQAYQSGTGLFPSIPSQSSFIADQIRATAAERFTEKKKVIDQAAKGRTDAIAAQDDRWISVKAQVNNAKIATDSGKESIATARNLLLELRTSIALAGEPGEDLELRRAEFDAKVAAINNEADSAGKAFNLVGNINRVDYSPNQIEYRNDLGVGSTLLTGTYIGGDFRIEANDSTVWIPDLGTDLLQQFSALQGPKKTTTIGGQTIDKATSLRNGVELVSYDKTSGAITVNITINPNDPPEVVTGTLKRTGIKLLGSWFYEGLATSAGRTAAFKAIDEAERELVAAEAKLQESIVKVQTDERRADRALEALTKDKSKVLTDELTATEKLQIETQQQLYAMQVNLDNLSQQQQNYLNAFGGFINNKFSQFNLSLTV